MGEYGKITSLKLMSYATDSCALMRMSSLEEATNMVETLHGNIPQGLTAPISVRYADTPKAKAKKLHQALAASMGLPEPTPEENYGPVQGGKGKVIKAKNSPYGKGGETVRY